MTHFEVPSAQEAHVKVTKPSDRARRRRLPWSRVLVLIWGLIVGLPLLWMLVGSFKSNQEIFGSPLTLPSAWRWANYSTVLIEEGMGRAFLNSLVVVSIAVPAVLLFGAMAAHVLSRARFRAAGLITWAFLGGLAVPLLLGIVPLFELVTNLGLINNLLGYSLVLVAYQIPFTIYLLYPFFQTIPRVMEEAAMMDGCSHPRTFWHVMLPLAGPGLAAAGIFNFIYMWNEYTLALILLNDESARTLPVQVGRLMFRSQFLVDWGAMFAGLVVSAAPPFLGYLLLKGHIAKGFRAGAVKE